MRLLLLPVAELALLAVVLLGFYHRAPKCPKCGALENQHDSFFPHVRICRRCQEIYQIRD